MLPHLFLAAALHAGAMPAIGLAEIGGKVTLDGTAVVPRPTEVRLYSDTACLASTSPDARGTYLFRVPPGAYWLAVEVNGREVEAVPVTVGARSTLQNVDIPEAALDDVTRAELQLPAHSASARHAALDRPGTVCTGMEARLTRS
jgi:hypothetical protein